MSEAIDCEHSALRRVHDAFDNVSMEIETNDNPVPKFAAEEIRVARMFSGTPVAL